MIPVSLVIGPAGTGKTWWLLDRLKREAPSLIKKDHQRVLVLSKMHGARRRLQMKLREECPSIKVLVTTIDGAALSHLNRWRTARAFSRPVQAGSAFDGLLETEFGVEASYSRVLEESSALFKGEHVGRLFAESFPLVVVDEFQDCDDGTLQFVKDLTRWTRVLLAADEFQQLKQGAWKSEAVEWVRRMELEGAAEVVALQKCYRTDHAGILAAAQALREGQASTIQTVPVVCCPNHGPAAWKIIEKLVFARPPWKGTSALICPTNDPITEKVLASCNSQLEKRSMEPMFWKREMNAKDKLKALREAIPEDALDLLNAGRSFASIRVTMPIALNALQAAKRFAKLRGVDLTEGILNRHLEYALHRQSAFGLNQAIRTVTTAHGAKNREFDNVFVLWTHKVNQASNSEMDKRRLLYNAITRAKKNCVVLVYGDVKRALNDPVLSLLGPPFPAFPPKPKKVVV